MSNKTMSANVSPITKYKLFILQLKVHKSNLNAIKLATFWIELNGGPFNDPVFGLSRTSSSLSAELLYMQPTFTQQLIWIANVICLFNTSQSFSCLPNVPRSQRRHVFTAPCWDYNGSPIARQTNGVMQQTVTPKHMYGRVCSNRTTGDCRLLCQYRKCFLSAHSLIPFMCSSAHSDRRVFMRVFDVYYTF